MKKIEVRYANNEDMPFIKKCLINSWVEHAKNVPDLLEEDRMKESDVENYYKAALESDNSVVLIAEIENTPVGLMRGDIKEIEPFFKHNKILYLDDIYIVEKHRKQGIARLLFSEIEKYAKKKGIKRLQGRAYNYNEPIRKLLVSLGYKTPHSTWDKVLE